MRTAQHALAAIALAFLVVSLTPNGTLFHWVAGLALLLASIGYASRADNHHIRFGRPA